MQRLNTHPLDCGQTLVLPIKLTDSLQRMTSQVRLETMIQISSGTFWGHASLGAWTIIFEANMMERKDHVERSCRDRGWCLRNPILQPWAFEVFTFGSKKAFEMIPTLATDLMATSRETLRQYQTAQMLLKSWPTVSIKDGKWLLF